MQKSNAPCWIFGLIVLASLPISSCAPKATPTASTIVMTPTQAPAVSSPTQAPVTPAVPSAIPSSAATANPTPTPVPLQPFSLKPGDFYFSVDGQNQFTLSRNLTGKTQEDFDTILEWAHKGGTKLIRLHLTHGWWGDPWIQKDWTVNEKWAQDWDGFFNRAQANGISVIPVFGVWADWNTGTPDWGSALWMYNPLNPANGGPLDQPQELFLAGSATQNLWMQWLKTLVERWQARNNIAAWEIFSEINIASGASGHMDPKGGVDEPSGVDFTNRAVKIIQEADPQHRPITLSLAGVYSENEEWAEFYRLNNLDFIEIHPYNDKLDRELIKDIRSKLVKYQKPVMIGESGLWSMAHNARAETGIQHAIWAGLVSGAMNGRALWDNDGYAIYSISNRADAIQFMQGYATAEKPAADFARNIDFTGYKPIKSTSSSGVWGAALGSENSAIGWFRDAACEPPNWDLQPILSGQTVTLTVPGSNPSWRVDFFDTRTGTTLLASSTVARTGQTLLIQLPDFQDAIAFKMAPEK